jgi:hypothetical protein
MPADTRYLENPYASSTASAPTPRELSNSDLDVLLTRIDRHVHYSRPDVYVGTYRPRSFIAASDISL